MPAGKPESRAKPGRSAADRRAASHPPLRYWLPPAPTPRSPRVTEQWSKTVWASALYPPHAQSPSGRCSSGSRTTEREPGKTGFPNARSCQVRTYGRASPRLSPTPVATVQIGNQPGQPLRAVRAGSLMREFRWPRGQARQPSCESRRSTSPRVNLAESCLAPGKSVPRLRCEHAHYDRG